MINFNGELINQHNFNLNPDNRGFKFGDAIFDTLKCDNKIQFIEDHYFRLMSSMRMLRMKIPMHFTLNFYEAEIKKTIASNNLDNSSRIRVSVFRKNGGLYLPKSNDINFLIEANPLLASEKNKYEIELYKDFTVLSGLLSTIKTNNRIVNVLANIFADENGMDNCVLLNEKKNIVELTNANIFLIKENQVITPPLTDGCINGIIRKNVIEMLNLNQEFDVVQKSIAPFELLNAEEVFITNSIIGFQSVTQYRKKKYTVQKTKKIKELFAELIP